MILGKKIPKNFGNQEGVPRDAVAVLRVDGNAEACPPFVMIATGGKFNVETRNREKHFGQPWIVTQPEARSSDILLDATLLRSLLVFWPRLILPPATFLAGFFFKLRTRACDRCVD